LLDGHCHNASLFDWNLHLRKYQQTSEHWCNT